MNNSPKVSIILTSYNHSKYLREAIDSVLCQTFNNYELIIWDDASTDDSWQIIQSYTDLRIRAFKNPQRMFGGNVNRALEITQAEYIAIHHSDDIWIPNKLEKQVEFLDQNKAVGAVFSNALIIDENGENFNNENHFHFTIFNQKNRSRQEWLRYFFLNANSLCHPSVLIRKQCYIDCGAYRHGFGQLADFDMWVRLALKYEIHIIPEKLIKFRLRDNEANSSANNLENQSRMFYEFSLILDNYSKIDCINELIRVFPEASKFCNGDSPDIRYALAMSIIELKPFNFSIQYALKILFDLLNDPSHKLKFKSNDFIKLTGELDPLEIKLREQLNHNVTKLTIKIDNLHQTATEKDGLLQSLSNTLAEKEAVISGLHQTANEKDDHIVILQQKLIEKKGQIDSFNEIINKKNSFISDLLAMIERDAEIARLVQAVTEHEAEITRLRHSVKALRNSKSWRFTSLIRSIASLGQPSTRLVKSVRHAALESGGYLNLTQKVLAVAKREGLSGVSDRIADVVEHHVPVAIESGQPAHRNDYQTWIKLYDTLDEQAIQNIQQEIAAFKSKPKISVVMPVYNAPLNFLEEAIRSVQNQIYENWELCIADDASTDKAIRPLLERFSKEDSRIKVTCRTKNGHISAASNSALSLATGEFVALLDNDDLLPLHALFHVAKAIIENPKAALIYSDEDKINTTGHRYDPYFKCKLNYELLLAQNMVCHLGVYQRELLEQIQGFRIGFEGAQDYDLVLRVFEKIKPDQVIHIPKVLYHWRAIPGSTALVAGEKNYAAEAARKAITEHLSRTGRGGVVTPAPQVPSLNRVRYPLPDILPLVSIIIPTRDKAELLSMCLDSLFNKTTYRNFEVIIVDNGSVEEETHQLFARQPKPQVRVIRDDTPFNYSRLNNLAAKQSNGELICLMNNDIEILTPDWLDEMVSFALQRDIGCVGAKLWYPDGRLQHGGVILGVGGVAGHSHKYLCKGDHGYFGRANLHQSLSAVTAACVVLRRDVWEKVNGLDEEFSIAFNDVDFCLRVREAGFRNVWTPYAEMNHHESASRGAEDNPEKVARFNGEVSRMINRWSEQLLNDPAYSPNLTLKHEDFSLAWELRN